jgi:putative membrane-bound dehydrogenase-like protein
MRPLACFAFFVFAARAADWQPLTLPHDKLPSPVWLRAYVQVPDNMVVPAEKDLFRDSVILALRGVPGHVTVFLNGQQICAHGPLGEEWRRFKVPKGILQKRIFNALLLRIEGGSLRDAPLFAGYFDEALLRGEWEMSHTEPPPDELKPLAESPARAVFTQFRPAATPLTANAEVMPGLRQPALEQFAQMKPAEDLTLDLIAAEPHVAQPTHLSFDARGRLWVAQYRQYPYPAGIRQISRDKFYRAVFDRVPPAPPHHDHGRDVISRHEDSDGDGIFDRHEIVLAGLNMANAALHGHGGLWVMHTPYLLFYPETAPDVFGAPEVRLAGFGLEDTHSVANGLAWGPDGWLYGAQGSTTTCRVTRPGSQAPPIYFEGCFVWRYHPRTRDFEIFAEGGGNTFSLEFDAEGRLFSGHNGGETRGWHFIQHGIYLMQGKDAGKFGPPRHPYAFDELPMMRSTNPVARFTHALLLVEGTALPTSYAGRLLAADPLHRHLVLSDRHRRGATFETTDLGHALTAQSPIFRPIFLTNGPDGAVYIADFCEEFIAHGQHYQSQIDPESGRIFRLRDKASALERDINLAQKSTSELISLLGHPNKWHRQTALRLLAERNADSGEELRRGLARAEAHPALECLWALHQLGALSEADALSALKHPVASVRAWVIRLCGDARELAPGLANAVVQLAATETDPEVRAQIASTARRLSASQALRLIGALLGRDADASDHFLPTHYWHVLEARCEEALPEVLALVERMQQSKVMRDFLRPRLVRRCAAKGTRQDLLACAQLLRTTTDRQPLIAAFEQALQGRALPPLPDELAALLGTSLQLRLRRGDAAALEEVLHLITQPQARMEERIAYVRLLGEVPQPRAVTPLLDLACGDVPTALRKAALAALQLYGEPRIGTALAEAYPKLPAELQPAAQNLLASRTVWHADLRRIAERGVLLAPDLAVRFGFSKPEPSKARAEELRVLLAKAPGDPYAGEAIFTTRCAACHQLFHKGGNIGPNLTAYQRDDLGTMLPSILDPSAEIREGFVTYLVTMRDGRTLSGFLADQDASTIVLRAFDGQDFPLARAEITEMKPTGRSLMPDGLLEGLSEKELRDFFAYLRITQPITR